MQTPIQLLIQTLKEKRRTFYVANDPKLSLAIGSTIIEAEAYLWREFSMIEKAMEFALENPNVPIAQLCKSFLNQEAKVYESL